MADDPVQSDSSAAAPADVSVAPSPELVPGIEAKSAEPAHPAELDLGYRVKLDHFSGPLDLLLYLVRRAEVDIADIPITDIADQFVTAVKNWTDLDLETAGDFVLMAATLLEIKARLVMPAPAGEQAEDDGTDDLLDPRAGLIRQLLAYRRFKEATEVLADLEHAKAQRIERQVREVIPEDPDEADGIELSNCDAGLLYGLWEKVLVRINGLGPRTVLNDDVGMESRILAMVDTMRVTREAHLSWLFEREPNRLGKVGVLMATLEVVRQRFVEAVQHEQYGDVLLRFRDEEERSREDRLPPEPVIEPRRRRRKPPLVTWQPPAGAATEAEIEEAADGQSLDEVVEEVVETDEQRFIRELEEACAVEAVLARGSDLEAGFAAWQMEQQQLLAEAERAAALPVVPAETSIEEGLVPVAEAATTEAVAEPASQPTPVEAQSPASDAPTPAAE